MWRRRRNFDLERELRSDLELEAAEQEAAGCSPAEAREAARRAFGNITLIQEEVREMWGWSSVERIWQDVRYAARVLRKAPGFTLVATLSLALGIGANTAIFSVLDAVLLKSLPVKNAEQLRIFTWIRKGDPPAMKSHSGYTLDDERGRPVDGSFSWPAYETFRASLPQFSDIVAFAQNQFTLTASGTSDLAFGHYVSGNYFTDAGVATLLGRPILDDDDSPGKPRVVVLSYEYWVRRFGADASVINRTVQINRLPATVVGVTQRSFQGLQPGKAIDLFVPFALAYESAPSYYSMTAPDYWWVQVFGRLKPGFSDAAAEGAVQQVFTHHLESFASLKQPPAIVLEPGDRGVALLRGAMGKAIYILSAVAGIILLIACANLANLLLARYSARSREVAIRVSIGAGRGRLLRQMLTESFLLSGAGAAVGLALAQPLFRIMLDLFSGTATLGLDARLDLRTLAFTFLISVATSLLFGTLPAWRATQASPGTGLKESAAIASHGASGRGSRMLLGRGLVAFQIALSLLLVIGTGLFLRTLVNLAAVDLGFEPSNLITFRTDPEKSGYEREQEAEVYRKLESRLNSIPGVESVGISQLPLMGGVVTNGGVSFPGSDVRHQTWFIYCSDSFLKTMRIPIVLGRDLNALDFDRSMRNAVVNETFVRKYMGGANPIGAIYYPPGWDHKSPPPKPFTIVGVAKDAHYRGVRDEAPPTAYSAFLNGFAGDTTMVFAVRTRSAPGAMAPAIRAAVASVDPHLPVAEMRTEAEQIERSIGTERLFAALVSAFGMIAIVLAAIGLYGTMAFSVSRRTSEIGIRLALGARRGGVQWLVMRQSLAMAALGVAAGVPIALELTELTKKLLYGVKPNDAASIAGAVLVILAVSAAAAWIPARRASRLDPIKALRVD